MKSPVQPSNGWLTKDVLLISLSAFFADMGYQAVTAVFPVLIVVTLKHPAYVYGILLGLSYGVGSLFSLVGGVLGNKFRKKPMALLGNLMIPLMSLSGLTLNLTVIGILFILGWWARYFRTPIRRAWLVEISNPSYRPKIFGFIHALDVGGGIIAVTYSIMLLILGISLQDIILMTSVPLLISSLCLGLAGTKIHPDFRLTSPEVEVKDKIKDERERINDSLFNAIILSATLFGFSFYAFGFPIVTVAETTKNALLGILTYGVYLGISAVSGYLLGSTRGNSPLRTLWSLGYLLAALSSFFVGLSYRIRSNLILYYIGAAGLGFATGSIETFEPALTSILVKTTQLSSGMGKLSSSRALGLFVSNIIMGFIFSINQFDSYLYAAFASLCAALILVFAELKYKKH
jgi:hypothetical protein